MRVDYSKIRLEAQRICDEENFSKVVINNSILGPANRVDSKIGEMIVADYLDMKLDNSYKYDLTFGMDNKYSIEVKTKMRNVYCDDSYIGDIASTSSHQFHNAGNKIIAFVSLNKITLVAEIIGFISVSRFLRTVKEENPDIVFVAKGTDFGKYQQRADGFRIKYSCLMKPEAFKEFIKDKR